MVASQRPKGITLLAWLAIISGAVSLITVFFPPHFLGLIGVPSLIFGFGALKLKSWAWNYGVVLYILNTIVDIYWMSVSVTFVFGLIGFIFDGLILYYLFTTSVKRVFGKA